MKVTHLRIKNVGIIADTNITIDKPLLVFYGDVRQGKTTILQAVKWVCGGAFPTDIIRHGEKEAEIELGLEDGSVTRSWYRTKEGETKARAVVFVQGGKPVKDPVARLKMLLNPFLLDQDYFRNMTELERKRYLTEQLGVDTSTFDKQLLEAEKAATTLRAKVAAYGDIDLTPVDPVNVSAIQGALAAERKAYQDRLNEWGKNRSALQQEHEQAVAAVQRANQGIVSYNADIAQAERKAREIETEIANLETALRSAKDRLKSTKQYLELQKPKKEAPLPPAPVYPNPPEQPDTSALEAQLTTAAAQNIKAEQYQANVARDKQRQADAAALKAIEDKIRKTRADKIALLAKIGEDSKIPGLTFEEDGTFVFEGTQAGMLSTSQIMRLSSLLSALYLSEGDHFGIELLDRGESLGRSIFDYVKHAEEKKVSVLATVVGEKPASVPENVGCWVVRDGHIFTE